MPQDAIDMLTRLKYAGPLSAWTCSWAAMFVVCRMIFFRKYSADFSNRVVSIVHAVAAIYYSAVTFTRGWSGMFDNIGGANTEPQTLCMALSLSYFIYDLIYCAVVGEIESVFHHMFTIGGLASGVLNGRSGAELVACLFLMEVSNPSLHLRTLLIEMGLKNTTLSSLNNLVFALVFLLCRYGTWLGASGSCAARSRPRPRGERAHPSLRITRSIRALSFAPRRAPSLVK
jgi:hypothetical protein